MTIDIWSDIMCPFCYIGKRKLETALKQFPHKDKVNIVWHSFQLDPSLKAEDTDMDLYTYLAKRKGISRERAEQLHQQLTASAAQEGLTYNFDKAVIANSFDAHRLIQLAKTKGLGDEAEERLFKAYFTEGENVSDHPTLVRLGSDIGLDAAAIKEMLEGNSFAAEVNNNIDQAQAYGISGVPFFVLNNKYGISGAQPAEIFLGGLTQAWNEYEQEKPFSDIAQGSSCDIEGNCD